MKLLIFNFLSQLFPYDPVINLSDWNYRIGKKTLTDNQMSVDQIERAFRTELDLLNDELDEILYRMEAEEYGIDIDDFKPPSSEKFWRK
jgi:hypothetical protein